MLKSLGGKSKNVRLPKIDSDGNLSISKSELSNYKNKGAILNLDYSPKDLYKESKAGLHSMTTLGGILSSQRMITSTYGVERNLSGHGPRTHWGVDIGTGNNAVPIYAPSDGVVTYRSQANNKGFGQYTTFTSNGYTALFGHLSNYGPKYENGQVHKGDLIGYSGNTGEGTGGHIHLQVAKGTVDDVLDVSHKNLINPMEWINLISGQSNTQPQTQTESITPQIQMPEIKLGFQKKAWEEAGTLMAINTNKEMGKLKK